MERILVVTLEEDDTAVVLRTLPAIYHTQINDVLAAALARALAEWTGRPRVMFDMEGHGREPVFDDVDLSRTVGWFTSMFPFVVNTGGHADSIALLHLVHAEMRQLPSRGLLFGVLRYLSDDAALVARLAAIRPRRVCLNYLGRTDVIMGASRDTLFAGGHDVSYGVRSPRDERPHLITITGAARDGRLEFAWSYSSGVHRASTIERVARSFIDELRDIASRCRREFEQAATYVRA